MDEWIDGWDGWDQIPFHCLPARIKRIQQLTKSVKSEILSIHLGIDKFSTVATFQLIQ